MKKLKKLSLLLIGLALLFTTMACSQNSQDDVDEKEVVSEDLEEKDEVSEADKSENEVEDFIEEGQPEEPLGEDIAIDPDVFMINESDYIAKIKLIKKGSDTAEIKILENIKGNLSNKDLAAIEDLELNRTYLVFLKDEDGSLVLTDENNSLILLEGDKGDIFEKIDREVKGN